MLSISPSRRRRGFTLIELLIALTIASVLTTIALPTLKDSMRQNTLSRSASLVKGAFINARSQAIRTGRPYGVVIERQRRYIGEGTADTLNFTAGNYATRMYYVQSPIEYRGDTQNAVCYPVFENNTGADPRFPVGQFPLVPFFFFPERSSGLLTAAARGNIAANNLLTIGTKFSVGDTGYVFEIEGTREVPFYQSNIQTPNPVAPPATVPIFQFPEPGTVVQFNFVGQAPDFLGTAPVNPLQPGIYRPENPLPNLTRLQQARFPGGLELFKGLKFRFRTNPIPAPLAPVTMIGKAVIDLSISGSASDPLEFGTQAILDTATNLSNPPLPPVPGLASNAAGNRPLYNNVAVMFAPNGQLDGIYFDRRNPVNPAGSQPVTSFTIQRKDPASTISFNIGYVDGVLDNIDDGARYPDHLLDTVFRTGATDPQLARPLPTAPLDVPKIPNFANPDCAWVSIHPLSGAISLDSVASQPPQINLIRYYGFQPSPNNSSARDVMRARLHQSRRLTAAGTIQ